MIGGYFYHEQKQKAIVETSPDLN